MVLDKFQTAATARLLNDVTYVLDWTMFDVDLDEKDYSSRYKNRRFEWNCAKAVIDWIGVMPFCLCNLKQHIRITFRLR